MKIKILSLVILLFSFLPYCNGQTGEWVWIHGSNTALSTGNFGIQGVPSPTNEPPALYEPCEWKDLSGNFWLFGGKNASAYFCCDLWKYDVTTNEWTWMNGTGVMNQYDSGYYATIGVFSPANYPPSSSFGEPAWVDNQGHLWYYNEFDNGLWEYDIASNMWACMKIYFNYSPIFGIKGVPDSTSNPGQGSERTSTWTDSIGNLFLFGGLVSGIGYSNTLWKFNTVSLQWTWLKGDSIGGQPGIYGTLGIEDSTNMPGARFSYSHWKDNNGNFWLFGGGYDFSNLKIMNDLWRYNPSTNNFTWIAGSNSLNAPGNYGIKCYMSPTNIPAARFENKAVFTDSNGNFWMFGGAKTNTSSTTRNDLWMYNALINEWVWISGDSTYNPTGNWGTLGISSPSNKPNGRMGAVMWGDASGHLYLFGGFEDSYNGIPINDLWKFTIDTACISTAISELISDNQEIETYPNPATGELTIIIHKDYLHKAEFTLVNILGEKVFSKTECNIGANRIEKIDLRNLPNGIYLLQVMLDDKRITRKIEKH